MTITFEQSLYKISSLVNKFRKNIAQYKSANYDYNEQVTRSEFINPFFDALGWDASQQQDVSPQDKEVVLNKSVAVEGQLEIPDYTFRFSNDDLKFFVEAKKPIVKVDIDMGSAYQLRCYAYLNSLPLSILTNFDYLAIYDCRFEPDENDQANICRLKLIHHESYIDVWKEIWDLFSRQAVHAGSLGEFAEKDKRGTSTIDKTFSKKIEDWYNDLLHHVAIRNTSLSQDELIDVVQKLLNRIIFYRMAEDRNIEKYKQLHHVSQGNAIYSKLINLFYDAADKYNSGLFDFKEDRISPTMTIDDTVLRPIINKLYYPKSPYAFNVISPEILGNVYENFLAREVRLTPTHRAKVQDKTTKKTEYAIYYTPAYVVNYIIKNTVGKAIENQSPRKLKSFRVLDPACGSGSFLLGAYQYLLDYYLNWYLTNDLREKPIYQSDDGTWRLTTSEKKHILTTHIFGVDIDQQAVEVTKLSLLLKVLENENQKSLGKQLLLFNTRALPNIDNNIKWGNSLIETDYFKDNSLIDPQENRRIRPFNWTDEFRDICNSGGFDCVVGNPPYISPELMVKDTMNYYLSKFATATGRANTFSLFIEKGLSLLKDNGRCGLIISNRLLTNTQLSVLRKYMLESSKIETILTFNRAVFHAAVDTVVITMQKITKYVDHNIQIHNDVLELNEKTIPTSLVSQKSYFNVDSYIFNLKREPKSESIIQKIKDSSIPLDQICFVKDGIILGSIKDLFLSNKPVNKLYQKWLEGNEVSRYLIKWKQRYIRYDKVLIDEELKRKHETAKSKAVTLADFKKLSRSGIWLRNPQVFLQDKILTRQNAKELIGVFDNENYFVKNSLHSILSKNKQYNLKYILALINSKLMNFYFQDQIGCTGKIFSQMKIEYIRKLPIRPIDINNGEDFAIHNKIIFLVEQLLKLYKQHDNESSTQKILVKRNIDAIEGDIDHIVYSLYGLTPEDIRIVEAG